MQEQENEHSSRQEARWARRGGTLLGYTRECRRSRFKGENYGQSTNRVHRGQMRTHKARLAGSNIHHRIGTGFWAHQCQQSITRQKVCSEDTRQVGEREGKPGCPSNAVKLPLNGAPSHAEAAPRSQLPSLLSLPPPGHAQPQPHVAHSLHTPSWDRLQAQACPE